MGTLKIRVTYNHSEIIYEQTIRESLSFAATNIKGHSKSADQEVLMGTIKGMCEEVKALNGDKDGL